MCLRRWQFEQESVRRTCTDSASSFPHRPVTPFVGTPRQDRRQTLRSTLQDVAHRLRSFQLSPLRSRFVTSPAFSRRPSGSRSYTFDVACAAASSTVDAGLHPLRWLFFSFLVSRCLRLVHSAPARLSRLLCYVAALSLTRLCLPFDASSESPSSLCFFALLSSSLPPHPLRRRLSRVYERHAAAAVAHPALSRLHRLPSSPPLPSLSVSPFPSSHPLSTTSASVQEDEGIITDPSLPPLLPPIPRRPFRPHFRSLSQGHFTTTYAYYKNSRQPLLDLAEQTAPSSTPEDVAKAEQTFSIYHRLILGRPAPFSASQWREDLQSLVEQERHMLCGGDETKHRQVKETLRLLLDGAWFNPSPGRVPSALGFLRGLRSRTSLPTISTAKVSPFDELLRLV